MSADHPARPTGAARGPAGDRTPLIAGNWKMYKTISEAESFIAALLPRVSAVDGVDVAICPPFLALQAMVDSTRGSRVAVCAQNMHHKADGAFTGEVSAAMLSEVGVQGVILGHSERRELFGETDRALQLKVPAALSGVRVIDSESLPRRSGFASASKRNFSQASEALETNSRRKISLCEYSEWITRRNTCLVSAWNSLISGVIAF